MWQLFYRAVPKSVCHADELEKIWGAVSISEVSNQLFIRILAHHTLTYYIGGACNGL
jgi:hypothetical protein